MLPSDRSRSVTAAWGRLPPWATAPYVVLGKSARSGRRRSTGSTPEFAADVEDRVDTPVRSGRSRALGMAYRQSADDRAQR